MFIHRERAVPVGVGPTFDALLTLPVTELFQRGWGPFPPVVELLAQDGDWDQVGQSRTIRLAGGGRITEQLTAVEAPHRLAYTLTEIGGRLGLLAQRVEAEWSVEPAGAGAVVGWSWTMHPRSAWLAPVLPGFGLLWRRYADRLLDTLAELLPVGEQP